MKIKPFGVEIWMNQYETQCAYNLAETCVESLTVAQLLDLAGKRGAILEELLPLKLTYGAIEGTDRLRSNIASLYTRQKPENVTITHGAIGANALVYATLVEPGDRVISVLPTYQQHYSIPESLGADVQIHKLREENAFLPDFDEIERLITPNTKLIAVTNPNNPTGSVMDRAMMQRVADLAARSGAYVLCDEVYRGVDQAGDALPVSMVDLYERGISTGSMSKAFSLAGLRLGWIVGPKDLIHAVSIHRDYNTISVGMLEDHFASIALENRDAILARNRGIVRENLAILDRWVAEEPAISYVKPKGGTVALLKYDFDMPSRDFCVRLLEAEGVMFIPGSALDMEGYVRIGYANNRAVLEEGLSRVSRFLRTLNSTAVRAKG